MSRSGSITSGASSLLLFLYGMLPWCGGLISHEELYATSSNVYAGTILLNTLLTGNLPVSRQGNNNVSLMCVPPNSQDRTPVPMLIRVKTKAMADELFSHISKSKHAPA